MIDLSVEFMGVRFKNPVVVSAGTLTRSAQNMKSCVDAGAAGFVAKSIIRVPGSTNLIEQPESLQPARMSHFFLDRLCERPGAFMHWDTLFPPKEEQVKNIRELKPLAEKAGVVIIGNVLLGPPIQEAAAIDVARALEEAGADIIEVHYSCPILASPQERDALAIDLIKDIYRTFKGKLRVPFFTKGAYQSPTSFLARLRAIVGEGGRGLSISPDVSGTAINIETGKPVGVIPIVQGPGNTPMLSFATALAANQNGLQTMSGGGLWTWRDIVERIMCGATLVSANIAIMYYGYGWIQEMLDGLTKFMIRKGYHSLTDFRGLAVPYIFDTAALKQFATTMATPKESVIISIDEAKCVGCAKCLVCHQNAITLKNGIVSIDNNLCERCGICASLCPAEAISLEKVS